MSWKIPFYLKCSIFLLSFSSVTNKLTSALKPPQEHEFWSASKPSTSPRTPIASTMETNKEVTPSETSRLTRLEQEISRLNHKFSLQDSKNTEYDKTVDFVKEFKTKQAESEPSQKREIETLKEIVSVVQSKEETKNYEMKQLKERLDQIRKPRCQKTLIISSSDRNPLPSESASASTSDKIATSTSSSPLDNISKSTNLPSSCKDLWTNGHTSNGIYLLYDRNAKKVSATFCGFNNNKGSQLLLGFVNVKSLPKGVHFYAQRTEIFEQVDAVISFDRVLMNEGGGLNGRTGIFRAPKSGIYQFLFHGSKSDVKEESLHIDLRVNGVNVGNAFARHYDYAKMLPVGVHSVVRLKTGDEVILFKKGEGCLYDDDTPDTHYSGWLVEEELVI